MTYNANPAEMTYNSLTFEQSQYYSTPELFIVQYPMTSETQTSEWQSLVDGSPFHVINDLSKNQWIVKATADQHDEIALLMDALNTPQPQIEFNVDIIELHYHKYSDYQSLMKHLMSGVSVPFAEMIQTLVESSTIQLNLGTLISSGHASLVAQPMVRVVNHQDAVIQVGEKLPTITTIQDQYHQRTQFQHVDTGLLMTLSPTIVTDNRIAVDVSLSFSTVKQWKEINQGTFPVLKSRHVKTSFIVSNNQTLAIAGLNQRSLEKGRRYLNIFEKVMWFKRLFSSRSEEFNFTDIVVLIRTNTF